MTNILKNKYKIFVDDSVFVAVFDSMSRIGDTDNWSSCFRITDDKEVVDMIQKQDKKMINPSVSVSFIDGE